MTTHTAHLHLPLLGGLHVPSALFFDLGVFAIVLGSTMLILTALSHQSVRSHRWVEEQAEKKLPPVADSLRVAASPLQGTTPADRQSRIRAVPGEENTDPAEKT